MDVWLVCCWVVFWLQHVDNHFVFILNLQIYYGRPLWKFNRKWDILRWYEDLELVRILFSFTYAHDRSTVNFSTNLWIYYGRLLLDFDGAYKGLASVEIWQKMEYYFDGTKTLDLSCYYIASLRSWPQHCEFFDELLNLLWQTVTGI